jgi:hypothetical protein
MPRPKTKSDPVTFRLPLDVYARVERLAVAAGQTFNDYVRDYILRSELGLPAPKALPPIKCRHADRALLSGGLARCNDCGASRNMRGQWT